MQNLSDKHSQTGFIFIFSDGDNPCNIFIGIVVAQRIEYNSKEEAEIFALDVALQRFRIQHQIMFQLRPKAVATVIYIDNQSVW